MRFFQLTKFAKARIWLNERATLGFAADDVLECSVSPHNNGSVPGVIVGVEALIPRGGVAEYGLIGIEYVPDISSSLICRVPLSIETRSNEWINSLASSIDQVYLGLPKEYGSAVLDSLVASATGRMPAGLVHIIDSAHGLAGSSPSMFTRLARAAIELTLLSELDSSDDHLGSLLQDIFLG